jgi:hypothetical protein
LLKVAVTLTSAALNAKIFWCALLQRCRKLESLMRTGTVKGGLQLFGTITVGTSVFGLWEGYGISETLMAAVILSAFVVGIAWVGALADRRFNRK